MNNKENNGAHNERLNFMLQCDKQLRELYALHRVVSKGRQLELVQQAINERILKLKEQAK